MRYTILPLVLSILFFASCKSGSETRAEKPKERQHYVIIKTGKQYLEVAGKRESYNVSIVDQASVDKLTEPLKALAAYYSGMAQSDCESDSVNNITCKLTSALGLGYQGSEKHVQLIRKWFSNDETAISMADQDCFVGMPGSSSFAHFLSLSFTVCNDTVIANYRIGYYDRGATSKKKFTDIALVKKDRLVFIKSHK